MDYLLMVTPPQYSLKREKMNMVSPENFKTLEDLYEFLRLCAVEKSEAKKIDFTSEFRDFKKISSVGPLINHLIEVEAPTLFGYIRSAQLVSLILKRRLSFRIFEEFTRSPELAMKTIARVELVEIERLRQKYLS